MYVQKPMAYSVHEARTLAEAPTGTRMLEVHALGYYPERRRVDVVASSAPIEVKLSTLKAVLDTVKSLPAVFGMIRDSKGAGVPAWADL